MSSSLSMRELGRQTTGRAVGALGLREAVRRSEGPVRLAGAPLGLTVMAHNLALLPFSALTYKGTDRSGAIGEIVAHILDLRPTVVGLCEVWVHDERETIRAALAPWYPHSVQGPGHEGSVIDGIPAKLSDGGLLLLSSEPVETSSSLVYRSCDAQDCLAAKGAVHLRIAAADIFYSHTQDIATSGGVGALYTQLTELNAFVDGHRDPGRPALIMGDLNIPAGHQESYRQLLDRLGGPTDCWTALGNAADSGATEIRDSSFYADADDRPDEDQRLDYILLEPGSASIPLVAATEILRFEHRGHYISDHFGITTRFDTVATLA